MKYLLKVIFEAIILGIALAFAIVSLSKLGILG